MTSLPPNADELVSAYLDGEAAPDEVAVVEANDELMARVSSMRALTGQLATPVPVPTDQREAHLAAAMGAFDEMMAESGSPSISVATSPPTSDQSHTPAPSSAEVSAPATDVVSLDAVRTKKRRNRPRMGLIAAAAAALMLFVGLTALNIGRGDQSFDTADTATNAVSDAVSDASDDTASTSSGGLSDAGDAFDEEAMADDSSASRSDLAENATSLQAPAAAEEAEIAMEEEEAMDEEEAAEEEAMDDADASAADEDAAIEADQGAASPPPQDATKFFLGTFETIEPLTEVVQDLTPSAIDQRTNGLSQGLFPTCQSQLDRLRALSRPTLLGLAELAENAVEVHLDAENSQLLIVDQSSCEVIDEVLAAER